MLLALKGGAEDVPGESAPGAEMDEGTLIAHLAEDGRGVPCLGLAKMDPRDVAVGVFEFAIET